MIKVLPKNSDKEALRSFLTELDREYENKASSGSLYELNVNLIRSQCEIQLSWYDSYIRKESKGLFLKFPVVENSNNQAICPICEGVFSTKVTLEHIIPKSGKEKNGQKLGEPRLAILPINLVKCCGECNTSKHSERSRIKEKSEIHPYFEEFDIEDYFEVIFDDSDNRFFPRVNFSYENNLYHKRIKNFIDNYSIEKTYNHRVKLEFQKILTTLAKNPLTLTKSILKSYIKNLLITYEKYSESEKIEDKYWFDQNYFGFLICKHLKSRIENDSSVIYKLNLEINKIRSNSQNIIFSNQEFHNNMNSVQTMVELEEFIKNNLYDLNKYYQYMKEFSSSINFSNLFNSDNDRFRKKHLIEEVVMYYLESGKSFEHFEEDCASIIG
ncbi:HNH endonuclease signature motif containing protein [Streptococcus oralis]|uniref:HNH endonuclease signature motif containing protein n=1 Tax=Streptococcus oralis TaxID=1303 RepID=UPI000B0728C0|nr:HNH endonuclease signature motif containing protein [Streptococcus oralis]